MNRLPSGITEAASETRDNLLRFDGLPYRDFARRSAEVMGPIGLLALAADLASVLLLMRYKDRGRCRPPGTKSPINSFSKASSC
jgi:hypothetical protein